jgi:hypothetical protein
MNEDIARSIIRLDESESLFRVEPLDDARWHNRFQLSRGSAEQK